MRPALAQTARTTTNLMPSLSESAGNGRARINNVKTGAMNDIGQFTICENNKDKDVAKANRRIRTLAISIRPSLSIPGSECIRKVTHDSDINSAREIEQPVVARIGDN